MVIIVLHLIFKFCFYFLLLNFCWFRSMANADTMEISLSKPYLWISVTQSISIYIIHIQMTASRSVISKSQGRSLHTPHYSINDLKTKRNPKSVGARSIFLMKSIDFIQISDHLSPFDLISSLNTRHGCDRCT